MTISCLLCCCNNVVAQKDANAAREKAVALNKRRLNSMRPVEEIYGNILQLSNCTGSLLT